MWGTENVGGGSTTNSSVEIRGLEIQQQFHRYKFKLMNIWVFNFTLVKGLDLFLMLHCQKQLRGRSGADRKATRLLARYMAAGTLLTCCLMLVCR